MFCIESFSKDWSVHLSESPFYPVGCWVSINGSEALSESKIDYFMSIIFDSIGLLQNCDRFLWTVILFPISLLQLALPLAVLLVGQLLQKLAVLLHQSIKRGKEQFICCWLVRPGVSPCHLCPLLSP